MSFLYHTGQLAAITGLVAFHNLILSDLLRYIHEVGFVTGGFRYFIARRNTLRGPFPHRGLLFIC